MRSHAAETVARVGDRVVIGYLGREWISGSGWRDKVGNRCQGIVVGTWASRAMDKVEIRVATVGAVHIVGSGDVSLFIGPVRPGEPLFTGGKIVTDEMHWRSNQ